MSVLCRYICGRMTNNVDGICAACAMDIHLNGYPQHMTMEEFKNRNTTETVITEPTAVTDEKENTMAFKICPKCGTEQKSNAVPKCHNCGHVFKKKEPRASRRKPSAPDSGGEGGSPVRAEPGDSSVVALFKAFDGHLQEMSSVCSALRTIERATGRQFELLEEMEAHLYGPAV